MRDSVWSYEITRKIVSEKVKNCGILVLGDSMVSHGVAVKVIKQATGLEGYNLSFSGAQTPITYYLFREALNSGAKPKFVVVDFFPKLLDSDPWFNVENIPFITTFSDCIELAWNNRDANLLGSLLTRKALPSARCRDSLRTAITDAFKGAGNLPRVTNRALVRNREFNRGLIMMNTKRGEHLTFDDYISYLFPPFHCNPLSREYIDKFMKLAAANHVSVILLLPPYMPGLQARLEQIGFDAKHEEFVRSLVAEYPGLSVFDARHSNYDPNVFVDANHLQYDGALTFSAEIGDLLRAKMDGSPASSGRWVQVPVYKKRSIDIRHESFEESWMAVSKNNRF
jgi:hypothetical protein